MKAVGVLREVAAAVPAVGKLLVRLVRDERVDKKYRVGTGLALAYAAMPFDLIPDRIPVLGKVDDAAVAVLALTRLVEAAGDDIVREHWDASPESLEAVLGALAIAGRFVPKRLRMAASAAAR
jgi:uncharacterized membrane protein YkvA (DUF1232 family)